MSRASSCCTRVNHTLQLCSHNRPGNKYPRGVVYKIGHTRNRLGVQPDGKRLVNKPFTDSRGQTYMHIRNGAIVRI